MGKLTTHVLDTARGVPCAGMRVWLFRIDAEQKILLCETQTNADGRCSAPLLEGDALQRGEYELLFAAGDYFEHAGVAQSSPRFVDRVALRFGLADIQASYHVPLLVSPWSYSTYRGS